MNASAAVVAVGASAGGLPALARLVAALPGDLTGAVLVTMHVGERPSRLPKILSRAGPLPATHAEDGEPVQAGRIYVAPPGRHLLVTAGTVRLSAGPRLNRHRPSVDAMFAAAAGWAGRRTVAVVLSGALDDGAVGAALVSLAGGRVMVQDPREALIPGMPRAALAAVPDALAVPTDRLGQHATELLAQLGSGTRHEGLQEEMVTVTMQGSDAPGLLADDETRLTRMVCPDCSGGLAEIQLPHLTYYRCHVGHQFAPQSLAAAQVETAEAKLWTAVAALEEAAALARHLAQRAADAGDSRQTQEHRRHVERAGHLSRLIRAELDPPRPELPAGELPQAPG